MTDILAIAAVGTVAAVCAVVVRKQVPELALLLAICAGVIILERCSGVLKATVEFMDKLSKMGGVETAAAASVIRVAGIAVVTRIGADFCRDAKESGLATVVETAGGLFALFAVIPLMTAVLELLSEWFGRSGY